MGERAKLYHWITESRPRLVQRHVAKHIYEMKTVHVGISRFHNHWEFELTGLPQVNVRIWDGPYSCPIQLASAIDQAEKQARETGYMMESLMGIDSAKEDEARRTWWDRKFNSQKKRRD